MIIFKCKYQYCVNNSMLLYGYGNKNFFVTISYVRIIAQIVLYF